MSNCNPQIANCATCTAGTNNCKYCETKFFLNANACSACGANCYQCSDASTCTTCNSGYHTTNGGSCEADCEIGKCGSGNFCDNANTGLCKPCNAKCTECTGGDRCSACAEGNFLSGMTCAACKAGQFIACSCGGAIDGNCATCGASGKSCASCIVNFVLDGKTGVCTAAPKIDNCVNLNTIDVTKCDLCKNGFYLSIDKKSCASCADNKTKQCTCGAIMTENCAACTEKLTDAKCGSCIAGFELVGDKCIGKTPQEANKGISGGAIAGIVIAVLVVVGGVVGGVFYYMKKVKGGKTATSDSGVIQ